MEPSAAMAAFADSQSNQRIRQEPDAWHASCNATTQWDLACGVCAAAGFHRTGIVHFNSSTRGNTTCHCNAELSSSVCR